MKIELDDTLSGRSLSKIQANFQKIEDALNDNVLWRDNVEGEPNQMEDLLDMNGQRIINLPIPSSPNDAARLQDVANGVMGIVPASFIPFSPVGTISSTNVQAAIAEVSGDVTQTINDLANSSDVAKGDALIAVMQPVTGAVARTQHTKNAETQSFADVSTPQQALDLLDATAQNTFYDTAVALKLPNMGRFTARRPGGASTGAVPNNKHGIRKTTNATVAITNFQTAVVSNIDCIAYTDPVWVDSGVSYPQKVYLEGLNFVGSSTPNTTGLYIEQGGDHSFRNLSFSRVNHGIYAKECWATTLDNVKALAAITWKGGTSCTFTSCGTGAGPGSAGGYDFTSLVYSTMNSCHADGATNSGFRFAFSDLVMNSCGTEGCSTATPNSGTSIAFDGGNHIVLNNFECVPVTGQAVAIFTVGANDQITFNQGRSSFGVPGLTCPDVFVHANGSTVIFNDYRFRGGSTSGPVVQFASGVTTSKVIVRSGLDVVEYTSDGTGALLTRAVNSSVSFTPQVLLGATVQTLTGALGTYTERNKVASISGTFVIPTPTGTGNLVLRGWPTTRPTLGPIEVNIGLQQFIAGGPLVASIATGGTAATFYVRSATGDTNATHVNTAVNTTIWFNATWPVA